MRKPERQHGAKIARMLAATCHAKLFHHGVVYQVRPAGQRRKEPSPPTHCSQVTRIVSSHGQRMGDQAGAVIRLRQRRTPAELLQFRIVMPHGVHPLRARS